MTNPTIASNLKIGDALLSQGKAKEAMSFYQEAKKIAQQISKGQGYEENLSLNAIINERIGDVEFMENKIKEAYDLFTNTLETWDILVRMEPANHEWLRNKSLLTHKLGECSLRKGNKSEAIRYAQNALVIKEELAKSDTANYQFQMDLSTGYGVLGDILLEDKQPELALDNHLKCLETLRMIEANSSDSEGLERNISIALEKIGDSYVMMNNQIDAAIHYLGCLQIRKRFFSKYPDNLKILKDNINIHRKFAELMFRKGKTNTGWDYFKEAHRLVDLANTKDPSPQNFNNSFLIASRMKELINLYGSPS